MKAKLLFREHFDLADDTFVEIVVWQLPRPLRGSAHDLKYRLALVENDICTLRYDNEAGKGDHRHLGTKEELYEFFDWKTLLADFWADVDRRRTMK
jgi:hypothetical protein